MSTNEKVQLTPAQARILQFIEDTTPATLYESISVTFSFSLTAGLEPQDAPLVPGARTRQCWFYCLELMELFHDIALEELAARSGAEKEKAGAS